jgi:hypothetical protein
MDSLVRKFDSLDNSITEADKNKTGQPTTQETAKPDDSRNVSKPNGGFHKLVSMNSQLETIDEDDILMRANSRANGGLAPNSTSPYSIYMPRVLHD